MSAPSTQAMAERLIADGADPASADLLAGMVLDRLRYGADGIPIVLTPQGHPAFEADGSATTAEVMIKRFRAEIPQFWRSEASSAPQELPAGFRAAPSRDQAQGDTLGKLLARCPNGNPYRGPGNRTASALLERHDPARAARLKAEAAR